MGKKIKKIVNKTFKKLKYNYNNQLNYVVKKILKVQSTIYLSET